MFCNCHELFEVGGGEGSVEREVEGQCTLGGVGSVLALMGAKRKAVTLMRSWVNAF